jgi:hypothetical protein
MEITDQTISDLADLVEIATPRFARLVRRAHAEGLLTPMLSGADQQVRERMCKSLCVQIGSYNFLCLPDEATGANLCLLPSESQSPCPASSRDKAAYHSVVPFASKKDRQGIPAECSENPQKFGCAISRPFDGASVAA